MNDTLLKRARELTASAPARALPPSGTTTYLDTARRVLETPKSGLDVYLAFDTTGSMESYISTVRENIGTVTDALLDGKSDIRLSMNGVGDHCDGKNMLQLYALSKNRDEVRGAIDGIVMTDGGDEPEAYECLAWALAQYIPIDSAHRRRAIVLIGDSVPHGMMDRPCKRGVDYQRAFEALKTVSDGFYFVGCQPQMYARQRTLIDPTKADREQFIPLGNMVTLLPALLVALAKKTDSAAALQKYLAQLPVDNSKKIRGLLGSGAK
ncbi:VWA domain-containing protein [Candidatus Woesearchaeota archaeon]|nr:VWA domain-containing protein [Candidatus Woesearchaeota archaeon]